MLRCIALMMLLTGCATAPQQDEPLANAAAAPVAEPPVATATSGPAAGDGDRDDAAQAVAEVPDNASGDADDDVVSTVTMVSENFQYSMTLRRPGEERPAIRCSYGKRTGSHFDQKYCRTEYDAELEREAAREFFDEARRKN